MDWSSYDNIASRYDEAWGSRFQAVAQLLWDRVPLPRMASVLDMGTGTGIVLQALGARLPQAALTGCDRSTGMVQVARSRLPAARLVTADAARLPFAEGAFDVVTASFVMSHLADYGAGLVEARRVLKPDGIFAMTSWAADTDVHVRAWRELLADAVSEELVRGAIAQVAPWESFFESAAGIDGALSTAGFRGVEVHTLTVECRLSLEQFIAEREIGSSGRFARHALGPTAWRSFLARSYDTLQRRFGSVLEIPRGILIGIGRRRAPVSPSTPGR